MEIDAHLSMYSFFAGSFQPPKTKTPAMLMTLWLRHVAHWE